MGAILDFNPDKAAGLQLQLTDKSDYIKAKLDQIRRQVERTVDQNWEGSTREAFKDLYAASSGNVLSYLNSWLDSIDMLIKEATAAKEKNEADEKAAINNAMSNLETQKSNKTAAHTSM